MPGGDCSHVASRPTPHAHPAARDMIAKPVAPIFVLLLIIPQLPMRRKYCWGALMGTTAWLTQALETIDQAADERFVVDWSAHPWKPTGQVMAMPPRVWLTNNCGWLALVL